MTHSPARLTSAALIGITATLLLVNNPARAAGGYDHAQAERYIVDSEAAWAESSAGSDSTLTKKLLAENFVGVMDGAVFGKAQAIHDAEQPPEMTSNKLEYAHVRFYGDTAVVQGSEAWVRKDGQKGHYVWIDTWVRIHGQWKVVAGDDISVLDKP